MYEHRLDRWEARNALATLWSFLAAQIGLYAAFIRRPTQAKIWALLLLLSMLQGLTTFLFRIHFAAGQTHARAPA